MKEPHRPVLLQDRFIQNQVVLNLLTLQVQARATPQEITLSHLRVDQALGQLQL